MERITKYIQEDRNSKRTMNKKKLSFQAKTLQATLPDVPSFHTRWTFIYARTEKCNIDKAVYIKNKADNKMYSGKQK